jgi:hypothetical protein
MQCMQALKLSVTALLAFVGIAATQPDANDPTLVKIDSAGSRRRSKRCHQLLYCIHHRAVLGINR